MGKQARLKQQRRSGVTLEEREARQLLTAQNNELTAQIEAQKVVTAANAKLRQLAQAKNAIFDGLVKKYHLDANRPYRLDAETLLLVGEAATASHSAPTTK